MSPETIATVYPPSAGLGTGCDSARHNLNSALRPLGGVRALCIFSPQFIDGGATPARCIG